MVKKIVFTAVLVLQTVLLAVMSFAVAAVWRGGLEEDHPFVRLPVLGPRLAAREEETPDEAAPDVTYTALPPIYGPALFLKLGPEGRMERLSRELERSRLRYEAELGRLSRRQRELDAWSEQIEAERQALTAHIEERMDAVERRRAELDGVLQDIKEREVRIREAERSNLERTAQIYERMAPDRAGAILTELYNEGKDHTVVKILSLMRDRNAAQVLAGIPDEQISADITEKLKYLTRE